MAEASKPIHPLQTWKLRNFKSIVEADLSLAPLNIIVGANSSGKSSVIQSILLFVQAVQTSGENFPLNGPIVSLGNFTDVLSVDASGAETVIGGELASTEGQSNWRPYSPWGYYGYGPTRTKWEIRLCDKAANEPGAAKIAGITLKAEIEQAGSAAPVVVDVALSRREPLPVDIEALEAAQSLQRLRGATLDLAGTSSSSLPETETEKIEGVVLRAGLPVELLVEAQENEIVAEQWIKTQLPAVTSRRLHETSARLRPADIDQLVGRVVEAAVEDIGKRREESEPIASYYLPRRRAGRTALDASSRRQVRDALRSGRLDLERISKAIAKRLPPRRVIVDRDIAVRGDSLAHLHFHAATEMPLMFFSSAVHYLGPLRQDPQVIYKSTAVLPGSPGSVGSKGEYAPFVLHRLGDVEVTCPLRDGGTSQRTLKDSVNYWIGELGIATAVETQDRDRLGLGLNVIQPGIARAMDMTSVGVGVSQLLPVVVMALAAAPGSLLLFEQPELHLHPAVQQRLGDFFLALVKTGRQLIVETHSEYLVDRLRLRIVEDHTDQTRSVVAFTHTTLEAGKTTFDQSVANEYGAFDEWPAGFFDQSPSAAAAMLRAAYERRKELTTPKTQRRRASSKRN